MVSKKIFFLVLTRNAFPASLLLISGNTAFSIYTTFWTNVHEGMIDRKASIVFALFS